MSNKNFSLIKQLLSRTGILLLLFFTYLPGLQADDDLTLAIQPILGMDKTKDAFLPLADYLR